MVYLIERTSRPFWVAKSVGAVPAVWDVMFNHAMIGCVVERTDIGRWLATLHHGGHLFLAGICETRDDAKAAVVRLHHSVGQQSSYEQRFSDLHEMAKPLVEDVGRLVAASRENA